MKGHFCLHFTYQNKSPGCDIVILYVHRLRENQSICASAKATCGIDHMAGPSESPTGNVTWDFMTYISIMTTLNEAYFHPQSRDEDTVRLRASRRLTQGYRASRWQRQDQNSGLMLHSLPHLLLDLETFDPDAFLLWVVS